MQRTAGCAPGRLRPFDTQRAQMFVDRALAEHVRTGEVIHKVLLVHHGDGSSGHVDAWSLETLEEPRRQWRILTLGQKTPDTNASVC